MSLPNTVPAEVRPQWLQRIRQDVQSMHAYAIQDSVGMVKLDAMENPHPCRLNCNRLWVPAWGRWPSTVIPTAG